MLDMLFLPSVYHITALIKFWMSDVVCTFIFLNLPELLEMFKILHFCIFDLRGFHLKIFCCTKTSTVFPEGKIKVFLSQLNR